MASFALTLLATTLLAVAPPALAQQLPPPDGRYEGRIALKDGNILLVTLRLDKTTDGRTGALRFDEPWVCTLDLRPPISTAVTTGSTTETVVSYAFTGSAAGRCGTLMPGGYMRVKPAAEASTYSIELFKGGNPAALYSVTLRTPGTQQPN